MQQPTMDSGLEWSRASHDLKVMLIGKTLFGTVQYAV